MGTFGSAGTGDYRGDLKWATSVIVTFETTLTLVPSEILVRLDRLYGNAAPLNHVLTGKLFLLTNIYAYRSFCSRCVLCGWSRVQGVLDGIKLALQVLFF